MNPPVEKVVRSGSKPKTSGVVIPHAPTWVQRLAAALSFLFVRLVSVSLRYQWIDRSGYFKADPAGPAIYCIWHNRLALCMVAYYAFIKKHNGTSGLAAMVSASKDGAF